VLLNVLSAMDRSHRVGKGDSASEKICVLKGLLLFCDSGIWCNCISTPAKSAMICQRAVCALAGLHAQSFFSVRAAAGGVQG
jgi:hypothetical protein